MAILTPLRLQRTAWKAASRSLSTLRVATPSAVKGCEEGNRMLYRFSLLRNTSHKCIHSVYNFRRDRGLKMPVMQTDADLVLSCGSAINA